MQGIGANKAVPILEKSRTKRKKVCQQRCSDAGDGDDDDDDVSFPILENKSNGLVMEINLTP